MKNRFVSFMLIIVLAVLLAKPVMADKYDCGIECELKATGLGLVCAGLTLAPPLVAACYVGVLVFLNSCIDDCNG